MKIKTLILALFALSTTAYYSDNLKTDFETDRLLDEELKSTLHRLISRHHKRLNYSEAKKHLFNALHLKQDNNNELYVNGVYCRTKFTQKTPNLGKLGKGRIPNHQVVNCEHTWPQSKFTGRFSSKIQKGDLHHLFPTDSRANSVRSSNDFGEVNKGKAATKNCSASRTDGRFFEPPNEHKGNVARAMFYFSVRYLAPINSRMEAHLKKWNELDPVDAEEIRRNNEIERIQGNRNPFIDYPELINKIKNF